MFVLSRPSVKSSSFASPSTATPRSLRSATALRGFKDEFESWKSSLTDEEKTLVQNQAKGEFDKKFRKSDEFNVDLADDKVESFSKILGKFFDAEAEDYKKEADGQAGDLEEVLKKKGQGDLEFGLKSRIVEINRDADRRYDMASLKIAAAEQEGKKFPQSSPLLEGWELQNNDTASNAYNTEVLDQLKAAAAKPGFDKDAKAQIDELVKRGIPAVGEKFVLQVPQVMMNQMLYMRQYLKEALVGFQEDEGKSEADVKKLEEQIPEIAAQVLTGLAGNYVKARDEVASDVEKQKAFFRSQRAMPGKTKADVLKELWGVLPKFSQSPVPPLDDEMLAELAQEPASDPEELKHSWGTAEKLYKSEAIDNFGGKYLLGIFETEAEATKAFDAWNAEYKVARQNVVDEMAQWTKREQAKMDADVDGQARVKEILAKR